MIRWPPGGTITILAVSAVISRVLIEIDGIWFYVVVSLWANKLLQTQEIKPYSDVSLPKVRPLVSFECAVGFIDSICMVGPASILWQVIDSIFFLMVLIAFLSHTHELVDTHSSPRRAPGPLASRHQSLLFPDMRFRWLLPGRDNLKPYRAFSHYLISSPSKSSSSQL
jgi:hypothetical protein